MATRTRQHEIRPSLVPAPVAGIASLIVPGLGQILARQVQRGLLLLGSLFSIAGLLAWRVQDVAHREAGPLAMLTKALQRQPFFVGVVLLGVIALWLWTAWDAYRQAKSEQKGGLGIFALIMVTFFILGWQIGGIDIYKFVTELPDAGPPLSQVLWPWEAAFTQESEVVAARADILAPCDDNPPPPPQEVEGQPYLLADPTCGDLSSLDDNNDVVPGSVLSLTGWGFAPNTETQIWWVDPIGNEFRVRQEGEYVTVQTDGQGGFPFLATKRSRWALQAAPFGSPRLARTRCCNVLMGRHTPSTLRPSLPFDP